MNRELIRIEALSLRAAGRTILSISNLSISCGELVGVLGPNGSGKTTLLRVCLGMQRNARGRVTVLGRRLSQLGSHGIASLRRSIGYVPQLLSPRSEMPLTVR